MNVTFFSSDSVPQITDTRTGPRADLVYEINLAAIVGNVVDAIWWGSYTNSVPIYYLEVNLNSYYTVQHDDTNTLDAHTQVRKKHLPFRLLSFFTAKDIFGVAMMKTIML